jgi:reactive chlorine resistance protein C
MTTLMQETAHEQRATSSRVEAAGRELARYGLVVVVAWIGLMKFTAYEAEGIRPFVANSPLLSWVYGPLSVQGFSAVLGVVEVAIALLIAARPLSPRVLGVECRRLPRPVGVPGAVPHQGPGPGRDFALDVWRGLESG